MNTETADTAVPIYFIVNLTEFNQLKTFQLPIFYLDNYKMEFLLSITVR